MFEHLTNNNVTGAMLFYSLLTFFLGPVIYNKLMPEDENWVESGFVLGFIMSMLLWYNFKDSLIKGKGY